MALARCLPAIRCVDVRLKRGRRHNELTRFRYDVILQVGGDHVPDPTRTVLEWANVASLPALRAMLRPGEADCLAVTGIPNARVRDVAGSHADQAAGRAGDGGTTAQAAGGDRSRHRPRGGLGACAGVPLSGSPCVAGRRPARLLRRPLSAQAWFQARALVGERRSGVLVAHVHDHPAPAQAGWPARADFTRTCASVCPTTCYRLLWSNWPPCR